MNRRQAQALTEPVDGTDVRALMARRNITQAGDGALITAVLAVDR